MSFTMSSEELRYLSLLSSLTGVLAKDCVMDEDFDRILFVVDTQDAGKVIGKGGSTVRKLKQKMGKRIEIVNYSDNLEDFAINCLEPAKVNEVNTKFPNSKKIVLISVPDKEKGKAIGKNGKNIIRAKLLLKRHYDVDDVIIKS